MTSKTSAAEQPFTVILDDDDSNVAEGRLRDLDAGPTWAKNSVRITLDESDTSGHALDAKAVAVSLRFDDDVEGHALSLHFPTAEKADEFRKRLIATGVVAGALVVGVTAAQLSSAIPAPNSIAAPAPAAAPVPMVVQEGTQYIAPAPMPIVIQENQAPARPQPATNPNIPREDIVPNTTTPKLPASHIVQTTGVEKAADGSAISPAQRHAQEHK